MTSENLSATSAGDGLRDYSLYPWSTDQSWIEDQLLQTLFPARLLRTMLNVLIHYGHVTELPRQNLVVFNPDDDLSTFYLIAEYRGDLQKPILDIYSGNTSLNAHKRFVSILIFRDS